MNKAICFIAALYLCLTSAAEADQVFTEDVIVIDDLLCVGGGCVNGEPDIGTRSGLKIKAFNPTIMFEDQTIDDRGNADWQIVANPNVLSEGFYVRNMESGTNPFWIEGSAPSSSLFIASSGNIGLGTSLPRRDLHIASGDPRIRFENTFGTPYEWGLSAGSFSFYIHDETSNQFPFLIRSGAPSYAMMSTSNGNIGLGTSAPEGKLHTIGTGTQLAYFESSNGGAVQVRFRTDSENRRFLAVNNNNEVKSQIVFGDNQIQFLGQTVAQEWLRISSAGIVSSGPTCNPNPCDRTFDPKHFEVPSIEQRAAYMWENMHLPAVGPTAPGEPFNLTEKTAGMLHELEVAHIYIEQLHDEQQALKLSLQAEATDKAAMLAQIAELTARLEALEER